jgi:cell division protein FtsL
MARANFLLILIALACALSVVASNHRARKLFGELEAVQKRVRDLDVEFGQLQLEQSTVAAHVRVEKLARDRLGMRQPAPAQVISVDPTPAR